MSHFATQPIYHMLELPLPGTKQRAEALRSRITDDVTSYTDISQPKNHPHPTIPSCSLLQKWLCWGNEAGIKNTAVPVPKTEQSAAAFGEILGWVGQAKKPPTPVCHRHNS